jgi:hypothetical protein
MSPDPAGFLASDQLEENKSSPCEAWRNGDFPRIFPGLLPKAASWGAGTRLALVRQIDQNRARSEPRS